jgi:crossover junction endodeoxyribonuclease RuvC
MIRILGVDPGTNVLGFAIIEVERKEIRLIKMSTVTMAHLDEQSEKLKRIFEHLTKIIDTYQPTQMGIEAPFYSKNAQSMLKLGRAQGVAMAAAMLKGLTVDEYAPRKVKQSITGKGNASKEQVAAMLSQILKTPIDNESLDATDALGIAICHYYQTGNGTTAGGKKHSGWKSFVVANAKKVIG